MTFSLFSILLIHSPSFYRILGECPNTYTFTKAIAEKLIQEEHGDVPTAIVRPSIVTAALKEPFPGWVNNLNHNTRIIAGMVKGILRVVRCKKELVADIIPVDITINLMIAVAWFTATQNKFSFRLISVFIIKNMIILCIERDHQGVYVLHWPAQPGHMDKSARLRQPLLVEETHQQHDLVHE